MRWKSMDGGENESFNFVEMNKQSLRCSKCRGGGSKAQNILISIVVVLVRVRYLSSNMNQQSYESHFRSF